MNMHIIIIGQWCSLNSWQGGFYYFNRAISLYAFVSMPIYVYAPVIVDPKLFCPLLCYYVELLRHLNNIYIWFSHITYKTVQYANKIQFLYHFVTCVIRCLLAIAWLRKKDCSESVSMVARWPPNVRQVYSALGHVHSSLVIKYTEVPHRTMECHSGLECKNIGSVRSSYIINLLVQPPNI